MPSRRAPFDSSTLLEVAEPVTPLPIAQRVQTSTERPFYNTRYLAGFLADSMALTSPQDRQTAYSFTCPICEKPARLASGFSGDLPFRISCSGGCEGALRKRLAELAPLAFEAGHNDIIYPFPADLESKLLSAVLDGKIVPGLLDAAAMASLRRFRRAGTEAIEVARYEGPAGEALMYVFRRPKGTGKAILPASIEVDVSDQASLIFGYPGRPWPIFGWADLVARPEAPVLIVEGEKTAKAAKGLLPDMVVVTSAAGSENAGLSDWSPLCGRDVVIWRDNDEAGRKYERSTAAHSLSVAAASVRAVTLPDGLPDSWDLADPMPDQVTPDAIRRHIAEARPITWNEVKEAIASKPSVKHWPPFRLPDGIFAGRTEVVKAIQEALDRIHPGCKRRPWLGILGAIHHALGESGYEMAEAWSKRDADRHGKFLDGEVRRIFDAFTLSPKPNPLPLLALFRIAMKEAKEKAGGGESWKAPNSPLALAYIADSRRGIARSGKAITLVSPYRSDSLTAAM